MNDKQPFQPKLVQIVFLKAYMSGREAQCMEPGTEKMREVACGYPHGFTLLSVHPRPGRRGNGSRQGLVDVHFHSCICNKTACVLLQVISYLCVQIIPCLHPLTQTTLSKQEHILQHVFVLIIVIRYDLI